MARRTYSGGVVKRTVLSGGVVERTVLSGGVVERTVLSGGIAPAATGPVYPLAPFFDFYFPATALSLSDSDPVASWTDVNAGKVLAQATPSARPLFVSDRLGYPAIQGDNIDDYLWSADIDLMLNGPSDEVNYALIAVISGGGDLSAISGLGSTASVNHALYHRTSINQSACVSGLEGTATAIRPLGPIGSYAPDKVQANLITVGPDLVKLWRNGVLLDSRVVDGDWSTNRFAVCGLLRASFVVPTDTYIHATGVAKGAFAAALHGNPAAMFAAASTEWGTP